MNIRYLAIAILVAVVTTSGTAFACRPLYRGTPNGFIGGGYVQDSTTGRQRLPANAKGVLFLLAWPSSYQVRNPGFAHAHVMTRLSSPLDPATFSIIDSASGKRLKPRLTRLDLGAVAGSAHVFLAKGRRLARCVEENLYSLDGCSEVDDDPMALISEGALLDVTAQARQAHGLFRVEPIGGFERGRTYLVTYHGNAADWAYPRAMEVTIAAEPVTLLSATPPRLERTPLRAQIAPSTLAYRIPADMEPYRQSMVFFTRTRAQPGFNPPQETPMPPPCGDYPGGVLGDDGTGGEYRVDSPVCLEAQGHAGLLEVEDLAQTNPIRVHCGVP